MRVTRAIYVEDDPALRGILAGQLRRHPDVQVCAAVGSSSEALAATEQFDPDVALIDLALGPDPMNGLELGLALRAMKSDIGIVIYSQHASVDFMTGVPEQERWGWSLLAKRHTDEADYLVTILRDTAQGFGTIDEDLVDTRRAQLASPIEQLTDRQRTIMSIAATGVDANVIAEEIGLSPVRVRAELTRIYKVLVPEPKKGTDLRMTAVLRYLRETRLHEQSGGH